jgi:hypothetical protein
VKFNLHQSDANPDLYELHEDREGESSYVEKPEKMKRAKAITLNGTEKTLFMDSAAAITSFGE